METQKKKDFKEIWLNKIGTKETALLVIKECVFSFFFVAALCVIISFFLGFGYLIDGVIYAIAAALLWKFKHVAFAIVILIFTSIGLVNTAINSLTHAKGGSNVYLAVALIWASIRAVQAALFLRKEGR